MCLKYEISQKSNRLDLLSSMSTDMTRDNVVYSKLEYAVLFLFPSGL